MLCINCGSSNAPDNRYCGQCGARLPEAPAPVAEEPLARQAQSVSSEFHHEVERQQRELQHFQNQSAMEPDPAPRVEDEMTVAPVESFVSRQRLQPEASGTAVEYQQANVASARESQEVISGPSFLGLSEEGSAPDSKLDYLYEDEPRGSSGARYWLAALIAIGFIGFVLYELKQNWNWDTTIIGRHRQQQTASANPTNGPAANPGAQNSTTPEQPAAGAPNQEKQGAAETKTSPQSASSNSDPNQPKLDEQGTPHPESTGGNGVAGVVAAPVAAGANGPPQNGPGAADSASQDLKNQAKTGKWPPNAQPPDIQDEDAAEQANETADANVPAKPEKSNERERSNRARTESGARSPVAYSSKQPDEVLVTKADAYLYGRGVPKNCDQALIYLRTAANRGNADARSKLGGLYATGHCVPLDRVEAYTWFTLARDAGGKSVWIERNREMLWSAMTADEKARAR